MLRGKTRACVSVSRFCHPGVCKRLVPCVCSHACTHSWDVMSFGSFRENLFRLPVSSGVRGVGGQEVSDTLPALPAGVLGPN